MKQVLSYFAAILNVTIALAIVAFGIFAVSETKAKIRLADISHEDFVCLQENIYFEAANQDVEGQAAVAWVTLNRMEHETYPNTVCGVVKQAKLDTDGKPKKHKCQFSWYCDGKPDEVDESKVAQRAWEDANIVAQATLVAWAKKHRDSVGGAIMYHADYVNPYWVDAYHLTKKVGDHLFYTDAALP